MLLHAGGRFPLSLNKEPGTSFTAWVVPTDKTITAEVIGRQPMLGFMIRRALNTLSDRYETTVALNLQRYVAPPPGVATAHVKDPSWKDILHMSVEGTGAQGLRDELIPLVAEYFELIARSTQVELVD